MQDSWPASLNAANRCFPDCVVLMCYFHVKENIRKLRGLAPEDILEEIMSDISDIHMAVNVLENEKTKISLLFSSLCVINSNKVNFIIVTDNKKKLI